MMRMKICWCFLTCLFLGFYSFSQTFSYRTNKLKIEKSNVEDLSPVVEDKWHAQLQHIEMPKPGGEEDGEELEKIKKVLQARYPKKNARYKTSYHAKTNQAPLPILANSFQGELSVRGTPCDNDIAISNNGKVISVVNSSISIYDLNNLDSLPVKKSLEKFSTANPSVPRDNSTIVRPNDNHKFDPKVLYDPEADRFIMAMLNGVDTTYSRIIIAFSQTNDPAGDWNIYLLPGNPLNNGLWSDYPQIAITKEDFFLTINLLAPKDPSDSSQKPWEKGFRDNLIWQINKQEAYSGAAVLTPSYYHDLEYDGKPIQYIYPIKSGDDKLEDFIYFLSNRAFTLGSDTLFLIKIPHSLSSGVSEISLVPGSLDVEYYVPPDVRQPNNGDSLFTNDARVLGGYFHNNQIQFVFPTLDTNTGFSAIYHGIIKNITDNGFSATGKIIGSDELEFGFPNISYVGPPANNTGLEVFQNESIITADHASSTTFPGISAVFYNRDGAYSEILEVKKGDSLINFNPEANEKERWGDYTGSQLQYNKNGAVWISGTYGSKVVSGTELRTGTWIAELVNPIAAIHPPFENEVAVFPNPSADIFSLYFNLASNSPITISLYDARGELVKQWVESNVLSGQNFFSFSTNSLASGVYSVSIESETVSLTNKLIKF